MLSAKEVSSESQLITVKRKTLEDLVTSMEPMGIKPASSQLVTLVKTEPFIHKLPHPSIQMLVSPFFDSPN